MIGKHVLSHEVEQIYRLQEKVAKNNNNNNKLLELTWFVCVCAQYGKTLLMEHKNSDALNHNAKTIYYLLRTINRNNINTRISHKPTTIKKNNKIGQKSRIQASGESERTKDGWIWRTSRIVENTKQIRERE